MNPEFDTFWIELFISFSLRKKYFFFHLLGIAKYFRMHILKKNSWHLQK